MAKGSRNSRYDFYFIFLVSVIIVLTFLFLNRPNLNDHPVVVKDNFVVEHQENEAEETLKFDIDKEIEKYKKHYDVINVNNVNNSLTCLLFQDKNDNLKSIVIENNTGDLVDLNDMFLEDKTEELNAKINDLLSLKYASFIVDGINNFPGNKVYEFKDNELIIYYQNYVFEPAYDKDIFLHVNYNEINDYLSFKHRLDDSYENEDGFKYDPNKVTVAISFDDGPNKNKTTRILKALEDNKMSATFFMVGNKMYNQKDIIKSVLVTHSEIGSHTYSHINMKKKSLGEITNELNKTNNIFKDITGFDLKLVRPPYGSYTDNIIKNYNYSFILWSIDTNDWRYKDTEYLVNYILDNVTDGSIILMHDSYETSVEAVEKVLPILYSRDIQVVNVSKLAQLKNVSLEEGKAYGSIK